MARTDGEGSHCSIARSLEVLGEKWTLLVVREAMWGQTRFSQFREALGVAPDVLADRLATLVEVGVMERRPYRLDGGREREEYVLTPAGEDLRVVLGALNAWGDSHRPAPTGHAATFVEAATGEPVVPHFVAADGRVLEPTAVAVVRNAPTTASSGSAPAGPRGAG